MTDPKPPSVFSVSIRSLFKTFFGMIGIALGLIPFLLIIGLGVSSFGEEKTAEREHSVKVLPNPDGTWESLQSSTPLILQLNLHGVVGAKPIEVEKIRTTLLEADHGDLKDRVKGLFISINTPGGGVIATDDIYDAIMAYKEKHNVPVLAHVDGMCASGGMWIACAADKILATEASIVGSVGVLTAGIFNFSKLMEKVGVESATFIKGKDKDMLNPFRPWTESDLKSLDPITDYYYKMFVDIVTKHRPKLTREKLIETYGAQIYSAPEGVELGYIDASGFNRAQALEELVKLAQLEGQEYQVFQLEKKDWYSELFKSSTLTHEIALPPQLEALMRGQPLAIWHE